MKPATVRLLQVFLRDISRNNHFLKKDEAETDKAVSAFFKANSDYSSGFSFALARALMALSNFWNLPFFR